MNEKITISEGKYWAYIMPSRRGWFAIYGRGPTNYRELSSRAWSWERIERKVRRKLVRWNERDARCALRVEAARKAT